MTNYLANFYHRLKGRHYARRASCLRRDLTEYVITEESRITVLLHRAAWHFTRSRMGSPDGTYEHGPMMLPPTAKGAAAKTLPVEEAGARTGGRMQAKAASEDKG